ncbi:hypothetical protein ACQRIU_002726 [Beauveria bassiana]
MAQRDSNFPSRIVGVVAVVVGRFVALLAGVVGKVIMVHVSQGPFLCSSSNFCRGDIHLFISRDCCAQLSCS